MSTRVNCAHSAVIASEEKTAAFWTGRTKEAIELARRYHEVAPNSIQAQMMFLKAKVWDGHANQTSPAYARLQQKFPAVDAMFEAWSRAIVRQKDESLKLLRQLEESYQNAGLPLAGFSRAYAFMGDEPNTVKWLNARPTTMNGKSWRSALRLVSRTWGVSIGA